MSVPWPLAIAGGIVATTEAVYRVYDMVVTGQMHPVAAIARVVDAPLHVVSW